MHIVIVNAIAGHGRALKTFKRIQRDSSFKENQCRTFFTDYKGHAEEIAKQVAEIYHEKIKAVIVIGGDGTLHEAMNGLKHHPQIPMAFIPAGSGNDFARGAKIHMNSLLLFKRIIDRPEVFAFSPGSYRFYPSTKNSRYFINSIGFGLDAKIAYEVDHSKFKGFFNRMRIGFMSYVAALFVVLPKYEPVEIKITLDGETKHFQRAYMVTVANHPYYGGGMKIAPQASLKNDFYSVVIIDSIAKWKILLLFMSVFIGKHTSLKEVKQYQGKIIKVESPSSIPVQIDGEAGSCRFCEIELSKQKRIVYKG